MTERLRVLLVEDEVLLQLQLELFLEDAGHAVSGTAACSQEARDLARRARPDLALVDIQLRDGPMGLELGQTLAGEGIPVVFMTASTHRIPADFAGALGVIAKPYTGDGVAEALAFLAQALRDPPPRAPLPGSLRLAPSAAARWGLEDQAG